MTVLYYLFLALVIANLGALIWREEVRHVELIAALKALEQPAPVLTTKAELKAVPPVVSGPVRHLILMDLNEEKEVVRMPLPDPRARQYQFQNHRYHQVRMNASGDVIYREMR